jgi:hypothetical protein
MPDVPAGHTGYTGEITVVTDVEIRNTLMTKYFSTLDFREGKLLNDRA